MENENLQFEHALFPQKVNKMWEVQKEQVIQFIDKERDIFRKNSHH